MALPIVTIGGIHLVNSSGTPTAGGAATAASTTPFAIRRGWSLNAPEPQPVWGGGPPFTPGRRLAYSSYDNVVERIPISVRGSDHENAVTRLQELKLALTPQPAVMAVQPTGSSTIMYTEIYSGFVREVTETESGFEAWEGWTDIDAELILTRYPFFGAASLTTLINAATFTNTGTGANNNTQSLGSLTGDLRDEGSPLNVKFGRPTTTTLIDVYLGVVAQRTYQANTGTGSGISLQTLSPEPSAIDITTIRTDPRLNIRILAHTSAVTNGQACLMRYATMSRQVFGPWVLVQNISAANLVDLGYLSPLVFQTPLPTTVDLKLQFDIISADGTTSVGVTLDYIEVCLYYTWSKLTPYQTTIPSGQALQTITAQNRNGSVWLPQNPPLVQNITTADNKPQAVDYYAGRLPVGITGASLYVAWMTATSWAHLKTDTTVVTVTHAPLYKTLRGSG
jgi:hypothetical protein